MRRPSEESVYEPTAGAQFLHDDGVRFRVWAPAHEQLHVYRVSSERRVAMIRREDGWHEVTISDARAGERYLYELPDGTRVPDPASRFQPEDVHGPSEVIDPGAYEWSAVRWQGNDWEHAVIYELHVGTFTAEGTFNAAIEKLPHLVALGVTALELMPVADFPGRRNWGYDGVCLYAPDASYGRPEDLKRLIDAAHAHGLMVFLDVVYNHFGPDGNYLPLLARAIFTQRHSTPWGNAVNYDGEGCHNVREFVIQNALYWIHEFRFDGLRLDAVHAILDESEPHLLTELAQRVRASAPDRQVHLILENEHNTARYLRRTSRDAPDVYTAQWNDDVHHVLHVAATGEEQGYYQEYHGNTHLLARALAQGFAFQGEQMLFTQKPRGEPSGHLPPSAFISFIQNHDQTGNRPFGERIGALACEQAVQAIAAVYLLAPQIPMIFMGEEWDARQPFAFFCDFTGALGDAIRDGRREEFKRFPQFSAPEARAHIPDPVSHATYAASQLRWEDLQLPKHAQRLEWYRRILEVRRTQLAPLLRDFTEGGKAEVVATSAIVVRWQSRAGVLLTLAANLSAQSVDFPPILGAAIWTEGNEPRDGLYAPWTVRWTLAGLDRGDSPDQRS